MTKMTLMIQLFYSDPPPPQPPSSCACAAPPTPSEYRDVVVLVKHYVLYTLGTVTIIHRTIGAACGLWASVDQYLVHFISCDLGISMKNSANKIERQ